MMSAKRKAKRWHTTQKVSPEEFVRIWQESDTIDQVAARTGYRRNAAKQRASNYRVRGVPLKQMPLGHPPLDYAALAALARKAAK
jgi:hypothetical protein